MELGREGHDEGLVSYLAYMFVVVEVPAPYADFVSNGRFNFYSRTPEDQTAAEEEIAEEADELEEPSYAIIGLPCKWTPIRKSRSKRNRFMALTPVEWHKFLFSKNTWFNVAESYLEAMDASLVPVDILGYTLRYAGTGAEYAPSKNPKDKRRG